MFKCVTGRNIRKKYIWSNRQLNSNISRASMRKILLLSSFWEGDFVEIQAFSSIYLFSGTKRNSPAFTDLQLSIFHFQCFSKGIQKTQGCRFFSSNCLFYGLDITNLTLCLFCFGLNELMKTNSNQACWYGKNSIESWILRSLLSFNGVKSGDVKTFIPALITLQINN